MDEEIQEEEIKEGETQDEETIESIAIKSGYNPDYDGPNAVTATEFLLRGRPFQDDMKRRLDKQEVLLRNMAAKTGKMVKQATDEVRAKLEQERREAVEAGDTEKFDRIDKQLQETDYKDPRQEAFEEGLEQFRKENSWYGTDTRLTAEANLLGSAIMGVEPDIEPYTYYKEITDGMRERYPTKFTNPNRSKPTSVGSDRVASTSTASKWGKLVKESPEVEAAFMEFVEDGVFKNTKEAKEKYAASVLEEE